MGLHPSLRENVRLLGEQLGQIMVSDQGSAFLDRIEGLRGLSKSVHQGDDGARSLTDQVRQLNDDSWLGCPSLYSVFNWPTSRTTPSGS